MPKKLRQLSRRAALKATIAVSGAAAVAGSALSWFVAACSSTASGGYGYGVDYGYGITLRQRLGSRFVRRT
jgi:hypothetical protein